MAQSAKPATSRKSSGSSRSRPANASRSSAGRSKSSSNGRTSSSSSRQARSRTNGSTSKSSSSGRGSRTSATSATRPGAVKKLTRRIGGAARQVRGPVLVTGATAAAVVKRQLAPKRRKVLGVPLPRPHLNGFDPSHPLELKPIGKRVTKAGKRVVKTSQQLAKLSDEVERVGKTAQKVGDSLS